MPMQTNEDLPVSLQKLLPHMGGDLSRGLQQRVAPTCAEIEWRGHRVAWAGEAFA
jgi:predicted ABC-type transport system involved in lysophospholipase L1 biosynthesis ATPase subunit